MVIAIFVFLAVGSGYGAMILPWEVPDEPWHTTYAEAVAAGRLPDSSETYEAHQPPLYYVWVALGIRSIARSEVPRSADNLYFPFDAAAYSHPPDDPSLSPLRLLRRFSSLLAALTIALAWSTALAAGGGNAHRNATLAALVVALLPQHVFIANGISNDTAAAAAGGLVCYGIVRWVRGGARSRRGPFLIAIGLALGVATKLNVLALLPVVLFGAAVIAFDKTRGPKRAVFDVVFTSIPAVLVAAALALAAPLQWAAMNANAMDRALRPISIDVGAAELELQLRRTLGSLVGRFGWLQINLPSTAYHAAAVFCVIAGIGLAALVTVTLLRRRTDLDDLSEPSSGHFRKFAGSRANSPLAGLFVLAVGGLSVLTAVMRNLIVDPQPQGRLLFPALTASAVLFAVGWHAAQPITLSGSLRRLSGLAWTALPVLGLLALNGIAIAGPIPRAFERSRREPPAGQRIVRLLPQSWHLAARLEQPGDSVVQTLRVSTIGLERISVPLEVVERNGSLEMTLVHLESGAKSTELHDLAADRLEKWAWIDVKVPSDFPQSVDVELELGIKIEGDGLAVLWGSLDDFYPGGWLQGGPVKDDTRRDLVMLFHYTDDG